MALILTVTVLSPIVSFLSHGQGVNYLKNHQHWDTFCLSFLKHVTNVMDTSSILFKCKLFGWWGLVEEKRLGESLLPPPPPG